MLTTLLSSPLSVKAPEFSQSWSRGSGKIPPQRSGDRGSRGTPPGTRIEHLVGTLDEGSDAKRGETNGRRVGEGLGRRRVRSVWY